MYACVINRMKMMVGIKLTYRRNGVRIKIAPERQNGTKAFLCYMKYCNGLNQI